MWPRVAGLMSMKVTVRSSSSTICAGKLAGDDLAEDAVRVPIAHRREPIDPLPEQVPRASSIAPARCRDLPREARLLELRQHPPELGARAASPARGPARRRAPAARGGSATPARAPRRASVARARGAWRSPPRSGRRASPADRRRSAPSRRPAPARTRAGSGRSRAGRAASRGRGSRAAGGGGPAPRRARRSRSLARSRLRTAPRSLRRRRRRGPMNVTRPSGVTSRVCGLAMSCSSAPKRSACQRVSSLASGSAHELVDGLGVLAERQPAGRARARSSRPAPRACGRRRRGGGSGSARPRAARAARAAPPP